jgi:hypothetical protein
MNMKVKEEDTITDIGYAQKIAHNKIAHNRIFLNFFCL